MILLDEAILPKEMQIMKAFLPFLPGNMQKMFAIYIKWLELQYTIAYFQDHIPRQESPDIGNLMKCLTGILPKEQQAQIEQFSDLFENMDMYRDMFEGFSSTFSSEQKGEG